MIIDRLSGRVVGARWVDDDPRGIAYSGTEQMFYVALADQDAIGVLEALSLTPINVVPLQFGDEPSRLLISTDRALLFVLSPGSRTLTGMSLRSLQQQFRLPVDQGPMSLAQDPVSGYVYVACEDAGIVQVVDPRLGSVVASLAPAPAPQEVIVDPFTRALFVGGTVQRRVYQINLSEEDDIAGGEINLCGSALGLAYNPKTLRLYAGIPRCRNLAVVRPELGIEFASVPLPGEPGLMAFDQEFRQLFVVLPREGAVAIVNPNRGLVETVVDVGARPFAVVVP
jgi:DNA-binding beta-propeller fold protein YncE